MDKIIKENDDFKWLETGCGVGCVVSKKAYREFFR